MTDLEHPLKAFRREVVHRGQEKQLEINPQSFGNKALQQLSAETAGCTAEEAISKWISLRMMQKRCILSCCLEKHAITITEGEML